uniref:Uncharacterized protein n=1 Tax=uncultured marine virus TaxID=186617 RepID=A0A0F7L003_9VIRU|nr:hypothetical protein [uncultured marine virus]
MQLKAATNDVVADSAYLMAVGVPAAADEPTLRAGVDMRDNLAGGTPADPDASDVSNRVIIKGRVAVPRIVGVGREVRLGQQGRIELREHFLIGAARSGKESLSEAAHMAKYLVLPPARAAWVVQQIPYFGNVVVSVHVPASHSRQSQPACRFCRRAAR